MVILEKLNQAICEGMLQSGVESGLVIKNCLDIGINVVAGTFVFW